MMFFLQNDDKTNPETTQGKASELTADQTAARMGKSFSDIFVDNFLAGDWGKIGTELIEVVTDSLSPSQIYKRTRFLDGEATKIRNSLGLGVEKSRELSNMVAENISRFAELGLGAEEVSRAFIELADVYGANISVSNETLFELQATANVTGQKIKELASGFRSVGVDIGGVGERMLEVTEIARNAGVSVAGVSKSVVANLDKMNLYNFEGGVRGLAKMSAQATKLGIDMGKIFEVVNDVFNPEGAIDLAAAMQRLGVQTSALLDPLRLMDLSQNDPTELQNQIVNMSKDFVRFNKELGQFEIMPGEKRRLNEIGKALGMNNGELQKMALNAANLEFKMKQIRFPSEIASKEDRELIATLATVNKEGVAEVRVKQFDEKGKYTGKEEIVAASELTAEQIKSLKAGQELQGKSMEEIAKEQLTEAQRLNYLVESLVQAFRFGIASSESARSIYEFTTKTTRETLFQEKGREGGLLEEGYRRTETYRVGANKASEMGEDLINKALKSLGYPELDELLSVDTLKNVSKSVTDAFSNLGNIDLTKMEGLGGLVDKLKNFVIETAIGGSETDPGTNFKTASISTVNNKNVSNLNNIVKAETLEVKPIDVNEKIDVNITVTLDPAIKDQALTTLATNAINDYFKGGKNTANAKTVEDTLNSIRDKNRLIATNYNSNSYIEAPGKA